MALRWFRGLYARIKQWLNERDEEMEQWHDEDPTAYYAFIEEQQRRQGGVF